MDKQTDRQANIQTEIKKKRETKRRNTDRNRNICKKTERYTENKICMEIYSNQQYGIIKI